MEALRILKKHNRLDKRKKTSSGASPFENAKQEQLVNNNKTTNVSLQNEKDTERPLKYLDLK